MVIQLSSVFNCNQALMHIKQKAYGKVTEYNNEFRRFSEKTDWNEFTLMDAYIEGLLPRLQERVISLFPPPAKFSELTRITNRIDHQMTRFATINNYNSRNNRIIIILVIIERILDLTLAIIEMQFLIFLPDQIMNLIILIYLLKKE